LPGERGQRRASSVMRLSRGRPPRANSLSPRRLARHTVAGTTQQKGRRLAGVGWPNCAACPAAPYYYLVGSERAEPRAASGRLQTAAWLLITSLFGLPLITP